MVPPARRHLQLRPTVVQLPDAARSQPPLDGRPFERVRRPVEHVSDPLGTPFNVLPAFGVDGHKLHEAMRNAGDQPDFHVFSLVEPRRRLLEPQFLSVVEQPHLGLSQSPREEDGIIDQRIAFAREEVCLGELDQEGFWRHRRAEQVVRLEVGPVEGSDIEDDHGPHHLGRQDPVAVVRNDGADRQSRLQLLRLLLLRLLPLCLDICLVPIRPPRRKEVVLGVLLLFLLVIHRPRRGSRVSPINVFTLPLDKVLVLLLVPRAGLADQRHLVLRHPRSNVHVQCRIQQHKPRRTGDHAPAPRRVLLVVLEDHQCRPGGQIAARRVACKNDSWDRSRPQAHTCPPCDDDLLVHIEALVQCIGVRMLRRLLVVQAQDGQAGASSPAQQLVIALSRAHRHEAPAGYVQHQVRLLLQLFQAAVVVHPPAHGLVVRRVLGPRNRDASRAVAGELGAHQAGEETQVRRAALVPGDAHVVDGQHRSHFAHLLVGLFCRDEVVDGEDHAGQVADPLALDLHRAPEAGIQRRGDPGRPEVGSRVQVGQGFRRLQADDFCKVPRDVEVCQGQHHGVPWRQPPLVQPVGQSTEARRAVRVAEEQVDRPEDDGSQDLDLAEA